MRPSTFAAAVNATTIFACCISLGCQESPGEVSEIPENALTDICGPTTDRPTMFPRHTLFRQYDSVAYPRGSGTTRTEILPAARFFGSDRDHSFQDANNDTVWSDLGTGLTSAGAGDVNGDNIDDVVGMDSNAANGVVKYLSRNGTFAIQRQGGGDWSFWNLGIGATPYLTRVVDGKLKVGGTAGTGTRMLVFIDHDWKVGLVTLTVTNGRPVVTATQVFQPQNAPARQPYTRGVAGDIYNDGNLRLLVMAEPANFRQTGNTLYLIEFNGGNAVFSTITLAPPISPRFFIQNIYDLDLNRTLKFGQNGQPQEDADKNLVYNNTVVIVGEMNCNAPVLGTHAMHEYQFPVSATSGFLGVAGLPDLAAYMRSGAGGLPRYVRIAVGRSYRQNPQGITDYALWVNRMYMRLGRSFLDMYVLDRNPSGMYRRWRMTAAGTILDLPAFDWLAAADLSGYTEDMALHDPNGRAPELNLGAERPIALILYPPFWETRQGAPTATLNTSWQSSGSTTRETSVHANFGMGVHGHVGAGGGVGVADLNVSVSTDMQVTVNSAFSQFNTMDQTISESYQRGIDATNLKPLVISEQSCVYDIWYRLKRGQITAINDRETRESFAGSEYVLVQIPKRFVTPAGQTTEKLAVHFTNDYLDEYNQKQRQAGRPHLVFNDPHIPGVPFTYFKGAQPQTAFYDLNAATIPAANVISPSQWIDAGAAGSTHVTLEVIRGTTLGSTLSAGLDVSTSMRTDVSVRGGIPFVANAEAGGGVSWSAGGGVSTSLGTTSAQHTGFGFTYGFSALARAMGFDPTPFRYRALPYMYAIEAPKPNGNQPPRTQYPGAPTSVFVLDALVIFTGTHDWPQKVDGDANPVAPVQGDRFCEPLPSGPLSDGNPATDRVLRIKTMVGTAATWEVVEDCKKKGGVNETWVCDDMKDGRAQCIEQGNRPQPAPRPENATVNTSVQQ